MKDADSGAPAPGTVQTVNAPGGPDSTAGVSQRSGKPQMAGDTNTARNRGTIQSNANTQGAPGSGNVPPAKSP